MQCRGVCLVERNADGREGRPRQGLKDQSARQDAGEGGGGHEGRPQAAAGRPGLDRAADIALELRAAGGGRAAGSSQGGQA